MKILENSLLSRTNACVHRKLCAYGLKYKVWSLYENTSKYAETKL